MADKLVQQNFNEIIIDDGSVKVPIRNKHGEQIGEFSFRPTDIGIVDRFNSVAAEFDRIVEPLESVNIKPDGTVDEQNEAEFAALREAEKRLYTACDKLLAAICRRRSSVRCTRFPPSTVISTAKTRCLRSVLISPASSTVR